MHYELINSMPQLICILDRQGGIIFVNKSWIKAGVKNGVDPNYSWTGKNYLSTSIYNDYSEHPSAAEIMQMIKEVLTGKRTTLSLEYPCHSILERRWFKLTVTPFDYAHETLFIVSHEDITSIKLKLEEAQLLGLQDPLTEIANRRNFNQYLQQIFARSIQQKSELSLLLIDIDNFKRINDLYGHNTGDEILIEIAGILNQHCQKQSALAARLVSDVFALISEMPLRQAIDLSLLLLGQVQQLNQIYQCTTDAKISISIGVASCIPCHFEEKERLYMQADNYLKHAKLGGKSRIEAGMLNTANQ